MSPEALAKQRVAGTVCHCCCMVTITVMVISKFSVSIDSIISVVIGAAFTIFERRLMRAVFGPWASRL